MSKTSQIATGANYNGRQPNNTAYIKNFVVGTAPTLWKAISYYPSGGSPINAITTTSGVYNNLLIDGDLYVNGSIINPSDEYLKDNIVDVSIEQTNKLLDLEVKQFTLKDDALKHIHYGFIAQEFEKELPELVSIKPDNTRKLKAINYLELIPLLVHKIQMLQKEIDILKEQQNN